MGDTCMIHANVWQRPLQYCKVVSLQLKLINLQKKCQGIAEITNELITTKYNSEETKSKQLQLKIVPQTSTVLDSIF